MDDRFTALVAEDSSPERPDAGPAPIQFRLKTMLAVTAAISIAFAMMGQLNAMWATALAWFLLLVAGHVAANAMGTRATEHASTRRGGRSASSNVAEPFDMQQACAPTTRLGSQARFGIGLAITVGIGAMIGCIVGTTLIMLHNHGELGVFAFLLAAVSSTGIGAFLSFLAGSCAKVTSKAWREATMSADSRR